MEIRYLSPEEKERSRELYEDCFPEDTERFVDYYYKEKCKDNQILVLEDQEGICSMIHLNPFTISMYGNLAQVCYIVAVATREDCRRNGYMLQLMERAFYDRYRAGDPFTFLIPANPDYYYSCGFDFWENQRELKQDQDTIWNELLPLRNRRTVRRWLGIPIGCWRSGLIFSYRKMRLIMNV